MFALARQEYGNGELNKPQHLSSAPALQIKMTSLNLNRDCTLPPDAGHRQFRFRLPDGSFKKMDKRISNSEELKQQLNKYNPVDVYVGVSCWLNPELVGAKKLQKAGWKHLRLVLLRSDYFTDYDKKGYGENTELAYRNMLGVLDELKQNHSDFTFARTHNGFQMWCHDWYDSLPKKVAAVRERVEYVKQMMKRQTSALKAKGLIFDFKQSENVFQIARVWGSVHRQGTVVEYAKSPYTKRLLKPEVLV